MIHRIHNHPIMERQCNVPHNHVIIDGDLYLELVRRFGDKLPNDLNSAEVFADPMGDAYMGRTPIKGEN